MASKRTGFTLIELLVVIAIIAILAAILFPVFASAKERARQVKCLNNLKQLTVAFQQYVDDNGGMTPKIAPYCVWSPDPPKNWCGTLQTFGADDVTQGSLWRYVRSAGVYICPTDIGRKATGCTSLTPDQQALYPLSYSLTQEMNQQIALSSSTYRPVKFEAAVAGLSGRIPLFMHESRTRQYNSDPTHSIRQQGINDGLNLWCGGLDLPDNVHYNGTTLTFADGHAKWEPYNLLYREMLNGNWRVHGSMYPQPKGSTVAWPIPNP